MGLLLLIQSSTISLCTNNFLPIKVPWKTLACVVNYPPWVARHFCSIYRTLSGPALVNEVTVQMLLILNTIFSIYHNFSSKQFKGIRILSTSFAHILAFASATGNILEQPLEKNEGNTAPFNSFPWLHN